MNPDLAQRLPAPRSPHRPRAWRAATALVVALSACGFASAQVLINPVVVELGANQRTASVSITLSEKAPKPMRLQAELLRWAQDVQGESVTEPSDDLLVTPPIADLRPGEKQLFRVALRGARAGAGELAYRLILEDVGPGQAQSDEASGATIKFRMRYDLPLLVAPAGQVMTALTWRPCEPPPDAGAARSAEACLRMRNAGNRRVKVQSLTLAGQGWEQVLALKQGAGQNVLAGAEREWHIPLDAGKTGAPHGVQVKTADGETLQVEARSD